MFLDNAVTWFFIESIEKSTTKKLAVRLGVFCFSAMYFYLG
jgi:hypothetical protein